jgi:hypothetical protein
MKLKVVLLGYLCRFAPEGERTFLLELKPGVTTGQLADFLELPVTFKPLILINGCYATKDNKLNDGDTVTYSLPSVGG